MPNEVDELMAKIPKVEEIDHTCDFCDWFSENRGVVAYGEMGKCLAPEDASRFSGTSVYRKNEFSCWVNNPDNWGK